MALQHISHAVHYIVSGHPVTSSLPAAKAFFPSELYDSGYCSPGMKPSNNKIERMHRIIGQMELDRLVKYAKH